MTLSLVVFQRLPVAAGVFGGYVLVHTTLANLLVFATTMGFLWIRIRREERHLALDPAYRAYMLRVRYRLVPFVL